MPIILYNPQSSANKKPVLPCSLLAVGAVLEGAHEYEIVDGNLEEDALAALDERISQYAGDEPIVLGFTVMPGPQLQQSVPLARELKRRHPHIIMVWGGYFPTQHWDVVLRADYVDFVVRGHGEYTFRALMDEVFGRKPRSEVQSPKSGIKARGSRVEPAANTSRTTQYALRNIQYSIPNTQYPIPNTQYPISTIPGLAHRDAAGRPVSNGLPAIPHPRELPAFNFERVPVARYVRKTFLGDRTLGYHSSYGCPFFCNFCAVVNMVEGRWFPQTAEQVADVVRLYARRWRVNAVEFYDNNFFVSEARVAEFAERIMDLDVAWWGEARIDTMLKFEERTWRLMRDSGLRMVFLGAESGSDETLRRMNKGGKASTEKTLTIARKMADYGIVPEMSFVLGNPPDPERDVEETMAFIRKVKEVNPATEIIMYLYTPVPLAGELYEKARAEGFAFPETLEEWISPEWLDFTQRRSATMPWVKQPLQARLHDFERVLNAYYPTSTDARLSGRWRRVLRAVSAWRYHLQYYRFPVELRLMHRLIDYQRPETSGF